jgi:hypothetical protein
MIQTIVSVTDTIFFEAVTIVSDVAKRVCVMPTIAAIPQTTFFAKQTIFLTTETIFPIA